LSDTIFRSGKYKGKTVRWVSDNDPSYLVWVEENRPEMLVSVQAKNTNSVVKSPKNVDSYKTLTPNLNFDNEKGR